MKKLVKISIFGAGNVATHLAKVLLKHDTVQLVQMYNRNITHLKEFASTTEIINDLKDIKQADVFIIALKDDVISDFSEKLKHFDSLIVHTSGSVSMSDLQVKRKGVFYPFQTFSKDKNTIDFTNIPILIEAENESDIKLLHRLGSILSKNVQKIDSNQRLALHIAGVFVANFVNRMYIEAEILLKNNDLSFDLLLPLIQEVAQKVQTLSPQNAQTGPAIRGDEKVIEKHSKFLTDLNQKEIYKLLSRRIRNN